jgi:hypothetical protein
VSGVEGRVFWAYATVYGQSGGCARRYMRSGVCEIQQRRERDEAAGVVISVQRIQGLRTSYERNEHITARRRSAGTAARRAASCVRGCAMRGGRPSRPPHRQHLRA